MLKFILIIIILSIIIEHLLSIKNDIQSTSQFIEELPKLNHKSIRIDKKNNLKSIKHRNLDQKHQHEYKPDHEYQSEHEHQPEQSEHKHKHSHRINKYKNIEFNNPNPWNRIIYDPDSKFLYSFFIKIEIPSFNNYHDWKNIINNIEYIPKNKELSISAPDEETAIAIINLIIMTFTNKISIDDIISKDLINISIVKTKENPDIKEKFREQIKEYIYSQNNNLETNNNLQQPKKQKSNLTENIDAYDGNDYSYL